MFYVTGLVILQVVVFDFNLFYFLFGFDPPVGSLLILFYFIFCLGSIPQLDHFCFCFLLLLHWAYIWV